MNLAAMRLKFKAYLGELGNDESDSQIDVRFTNAFHYTLPAQVPGFLQEGEESFSMIPSYSGVWAVDPSTVAPRDGASLRMTSHWITGFILRGPDRPIRLHTNYKTFWDKFDISSATTGGGWPTDLLFYDGEWTWRPKSNSSFMCNCPVSRYPTTVLGVDTENAEQDGIPDYNHAMCVSLLASLEFAEEKSLAASTVSNIQSAFKRHLSGLRHKSSAGVRQRMAMRTF